MQKYVSLTRHVYTPAYVTVSPEHWDQLPHLPGFALVLVEWLHR